jgi:hypothetical protein
MAMDGSSNCPLSTIIKVNVDKRLIKYRLLIICRAMQKKVTKCHFFLLFEEKSCEFDLPKCRVRIQ